MAYTGGLAFYFGAVERIQLTWIGFQGAKLRFGSLRSPPSLISTRKGFLHGAAERTAVGRSRFRVWRCQKEVSRVEQHANRRYPRTNHSEPKMHGVRSYGELAASQCYFGTLRGSGERWRECPPTNN